VKTIVWAIALISLMTACKTTDREQEILNQITNLSSEEILEQGDALMAQQNYEDARVYYRFIYENFPNSPQSTKALIGLADSLYQEGGLDNIVQAFFRYQDFYNRFPQAAEAEEALYMMGVTTLYQKLKPTLDTQKTREAMTYFSRYEEMFPDGKYLKEARASFNECKEVLARHEYEVAYFYFRRKAFESSLERLNFLYKSYPTTEAAKDGKILEETVQKALAEREK